MAGPTLRHVLGDLTVTRQPERHRVLLRCTRCRTTYVLDEPVDQSLGAVAFLDRHAHHDVDVDPALTRS